MEAALLTEEYRYRRHSFDYIILALLIIYGFAFGVLLFARLRINTCECPFCSTTQIMVIVGRTLD